MQVEVPKRVSRCHFRQMTLLSVQFCYSSMHNLMVACCADISGLIISRKV